MRLVHVFVPLLALVLCASCSGSGSGSSGGIDMEEGGTLTAEDGAAVEFPPDYGEGEVSGTLTLVAEATGEESDERKAVSGEYLLTLLGADAVKSNLTLSMPLTMEWMPEGWNPSHLQPEYFDEATGEWVPTGDLVIFDEETSTAYFNVSVSSPVDPVDLESQPADSLGVKLSALNTDQFERKYRIRVYFFSNALTVTAPGSNFKITYFPASLKKNYSVMTDEEWNSATGNAVDPAVPDFIEDLDAALNETYNKLRTLETSQGTLFAAFSAPQEVTVTDCGGDAGESPIGGPMKLSNRRLEGWTDMRSVAAHELMHVLQNQHYTGGTTGNVVNLVFNQNRWFIEASANYFAAWAVGLSDEQKNTFYTKDGDRDYLVQRLTCTSDSSMYTAAHLLEWIALNYDQTVVTDAVAGSWVATAALSEGLAKQGASEGLSGAYEKYAQYLLTTPDGFAGLNRKIRETMRQDSALVSKQLSAQLLGDTKTFITLKKQLKPLSMVYVELRANNSTDALFVTDGSKSKGGLVRSCAYDFIGEGDADYNGKIPIDSLDSYPAAAPITLKEYGKGQKVTGFQQLLVNSSPATSANINAVFYLLVCPVVKEVQEGAVLWSTKELGDLPKAYIKGYIVARQGPTGLERLNKNPLGPASSGLEQSFTDGRIEEDDEITVAIMDKFEHTWPEIVTDVGPCDHIMEVEVEGLEKKENPPGCMDCINQNCAPACSKCDKECVEVGLVCMIECVSQSMAACWGDPESEECTGGCTRPCFLTGKMDGYAAIALCVEDLCPLCDPEDTPEE